MMHEGLIKHQFKKGQSGNPKGRTGPSGREQFLIVCERWLGTNKEKFMKRLGQEAMKKPLAFTRDILIPLMPREMLLEMKDGDGKTAIWRCITEMGVSDASATAMLQAANSSKVIDVESKEVPDASNTNFTPILGRTGCSTD